MLGLGTSLTQVASRGAGVGVPSWVPLSEANTLALLHADYTNGLYWYNGRRYADETSHNSAVGFTKSGAVRQTSTPVATGPELVSNGDFAGGTTAGWTGFNSATLSVTAGALQIVGNGGNTPGAAQPITTAWGKAYRLAATTGGTAPQTKAATNAALNSALLTLGSGAQVGYFGGVQSGQWVGARINQNPANSSMTLDDVSVREAIPFDGWKELQVFGCSGLVKGTLPASPSGTQVIWQADDNSERNRLRLVWGSDTHLHVVFTVNNAAVGDCDLGAAPGGTAFAIAFSCASGSFSASYNGQTSVIVSGQNPPGTCFVRIGCSFTGDAFAGTIQTVTVFPFAQTSTALEMLSGPSVTAWGDSLTAQGYPALAAAAFSPVRAVSNQGVGGETSGQILTRVQAANRSLLNRISWLWMGRNDVGYTGRDPVGNIAAAAALVMNGRFLVGSILPFTTDGATGSGAQLQRIGWNAQLAATYGSRYVDIYSALCAANDGSANDLSDIANGWTPRSLRADTGHLNTAGYTIVAQAMIAATLAQGW